MSQHDSELLPDDLPEEERKLISSMYRDLLRTFKTPLSDDDQRLLRKAFEVAAEAHKQQRRKDGSPYITHPILVAKICVEEIGLGPTAAASALLHDVVEDTSLTLDDIREQFPDKIGPRDKNEPVKSRVAMIVDGLTKLDSLHEYQYPQAENIRRVLESMLTDVRVVLIKMADRLHNLRTISSMPPHKQIRIAAETESVYAPLAHKLGLYKIKTEFQDNCLKIMNREAYDNIASKLSETKKDRETYIQRFIDPIRESLDNFGLKARIFGRPKSIHSIHEKMSKKNVSFEQIFDLFAIRIIIEPDDKTPEKLACWQAYALVTDTYKPVAERHKDWVSNPKTNGYESLHSTVLGPENRFVEVQIRTERMDDIAERGFAAHWKYKGVRSTNDGIYDRWIAELREALSENNNAVSFIAEFQNSAFVEDAVYVYTPKGDLKELPQGATALDFAFAIHTDVGCKCYSVKVNGVTEPLNYKLKTGEQVEVITKSTQKPSEHWLLFVVSSKAKTRIKAVLNEEKRKLAADGKEILARKLNNMHKVGVDENVDKLAKDFGYPNRLEFLCAIALEQFETTELKRYKADGKLLVLKEPNTTKGDNETQPGEVPPPGSSRANAGLAQTIIINDEPGAYYNYTFAKCCSPSQGDAIFAYLNNEGGGANIHKATCSNAKYLLSNYSYRILKAEWGNTVRSKFVTELIVTGRDIGKGVIAQVSACIENLGINVIAFNMRGDDAGHFQGLIEMEVNTAEHLNLLISTLKGFDYVTGVQRREPG